MDNIAFFTLLINKKIKKMSISFSFHSLLSSLQLSRKTLTISKKNKMLNF